MTRDDIIAKNDNAVSSSRTEPFKCAGRWFLPDSSFQFSMIKKPNWIRRTLMFVLFGLEWMDDK